MKSRLPTVGDIEHAAAALAPLIVRTPLLESPMLDAALDARILFKAECLQRTGSFKFRGAYTAISRMERARRQRGIVAFSSGNHAQGVAAAARLHGVPATIVMPRNAPRNKIRKTRQLGAEVVLYDPESEDRDAIGERLRDEHGHALVRPYDDFDVICGQGTVGLEIDEQLAERGIDADELWCPCGGGGLIGGISTALAARRPKLRPFCVEPEHFDDTRRSLAAGERRDNATGHQSICDALLAPRPGQLTFAINRERVTGGLIATETQVKGAMRWAFEHLGIVLEPGGAVAVAAVLADTRPVRGRTIVVVCSGGNVDADRFAECMTATGNLVAGA